VLFLGSNEKIAENPTNDMRMIKNPKIFILQGVGLERMIPIEVKQRGKRIAFRLFFSRTDKIRPRIDGVRIIHSGKVPV
jgi:hypothetical protein